MSFQLDEFVRLRPFAYHVTHRENVRLLRASGRLRTAASVIQEAGAVHLLALRREHETVVRTAEGPVVLKDQRPLIAANLSPLRNGALRTSSRTSTASSISGQGGIAD